MFIRNAGKVLASALAGMLLWPVSVEADICWIMYQMADNNLEQFIRMDNTELIHDSQLLRDPTMTSWIYFDGRNLRGASDDITAALPYIYNADGTLVTQKYQGSRYLTFDHSSNKMIIDTTLPGEQDGDDPNTISDFVVHAMTDCVAKGSTEFFMVFASHGGGYAGFGSDENYARRLEMQPNQGVVQALQSALDTVRVSVANPSSVPTKFDIVGFDACLMQAFGALDEYRAVAKYVLASEATEPGHGWAYSQLSNPENVLDLATQIVESFVDTPQNSWGVHFTPKTLSVVDTSLYSEFLLAWDALFAEFANLMEANDDVDFYSYIQRTRASSINFEGFGDTTGTATPSALDMGSFITTFKSVCPPSENTQLPGLLDAALEAYDKMFYIRKIGMRTPEATGMHIIWPMKQEYDNFRQFWDLRLFNENSYFATLSAPNWIRFLRAYYTIAAPDTDNEAYVCAVTAESDLAPGFTGQLLLNPSLDVQTNSITVSSEIMRGVDHVVIEYGIDFSDSIQKLLAVRRHLNAETVEVPANGSPFHQESESSLSEVRDKLRQLYGALGRRFDKGSMDGPTADSEHVDRRTQLNDNNGDYLLYYGGDIKAKYSRAGFEAVWDRKFWGLVDSEEKFEEVYVYDDGNGARAIPVMYFPPENTADITAEGTLPLFTIEDAKLLGGIYSRLTFSVNEATGEVYNNMILYTNNDQSSLGETPRSAGGHIVPIVFVQAMLNNFQFRSLVGGVLGSVFEWSTTNELSVVAGNIQQILEQYDLDNYIIDLVATDYDMNLTDYKGFELNSDSEIVNPLSSLNVGDPSTSTNGAVSSSFCLLPPTKFLVALLSVSMFHKLF